MHANRCVACDGRQVEEGRCLACGFQPGRVDGFPAYAPTLAVQGDGYDAAHYQILAGLEAGNFWFRARNRLIIRALEQFVPRMRTFLEIGCGTGFVLAGVRRAFPAVSAVGSELFAEGLRYASARLPDVEFIQMDARSIPYTGRFDAIGAFDVIEHIQDDTRVLREMHCALVDGGTLLLTVPQHRWLWSAQDDHAHHVRRYSRKELLDKVEAAGFKVVKVSSFVSLLLPLMLASRLRRASPSDDPFREFKLPRWLDALLYWVMRIEMGLINLGISFPAGGSLLLVAKKETA